MRLRATNRKYRTLFSLVSAVMFLGALASGFAIWTLRSDTLADVNIGARNIAIILAEQMTSSVQSIELTMDELKEQLAQAGPTPEDFQRVAGNNQMRERLVERLSRLTQSDAIVITDASGATINAVGAGSVSPEILAECFKHALTSNDNELFVSAPAQNLVTRVPIDGFSKRINGVHGEFLGMILVAVNLDYFRSVARSITLLHDTALLILRSDGTVLVRFPGDSRAGEKLPPSSPWYKELEKGGGYYRSPGVFDGIPRLVAIQPLRNLPLVINVASSEAAALQRWKSRAFTIAGGAAIAILSLGILLRILFLQVRRLILSENAVAKRSQELEEANLKFDVAINNMSQGLCMFDADNRLVVCNSLYGRLYGLPPELLAAGTPRRDIVAYGLSSGFRQVDGVEIDPQSNAVVPARPRTRAGYIRIDADENGRLIRVCQQPMTGGGVVATFEDITEQRRGERKLEETKTFLDSIVDNIPVAVLVKDAKTRKFVLANKAYAAIVGSQPANLPGKTVFDFFPPEEAARMERFDLESVEDRVGAKILDVEIERPDHGSRIFNTKRIVVRDRDGAARYIVVVIDDITDRRKSEQQIVFMAHHDALTGLANRGTLLERIGEAAARQRRRGDSFAVLLLDLDRFKSVNDTLGHPAGDALLRGVALRLKGLLRETDALARLGGDEFAIIQDGELNPHDAAKALAARIIETLRAPFDVEGHEIHIGASIGIALAPEHGSDSDTLLKMADLALYRAKSDGRNTYSIFDKEMGELVSSRQKIESELRRAVESDELQLCYQPIIDTRSHRICCVEALVRWRHPSRGTVLPDEFIPLAEETGLIAPITEWVLDAACREAAKWPAGVKVAVNLSPTQFKKANLITIVTEALARSGLSPQRLELEITETALIESASECLGALEQIKSLGISVALDDFGTGYSSLSHLTMFPFDKIKIDKSFTRELTKRFDSAAIISATLHLAKGLKMETTAEGVETVEQYRYLKTAGVTSMQGYLFKRPATAAELDFGATYEIAALESAA